MKRITVLCLIAAGTGFSASIDAGAQMQPMPSGPQGQPGIAFSGVAPVPENQAVLDALKALGTLPYFTLTPQAARQQPTFTDGVMAVMRARRMPTAPPPGTTERDIQIGGAAGAINAKIFTPTGVQGPLPVILYFHGGGWVIGDSTVYAGGARGLARQARAVVVSVDYRLAPEAPFPAQIDPLRSEGELLANRLGGAGVAVERREWAGVTHEFFGAAPLIPAATEAQAWASERLRAALWSDQPMPTPAPPSSPPPQGGERG